MGGSPAVISGDSYPRLGIDISHSAENIATLRVTKSLSKSGFDSGVGLCSIWGFDTRSQNWSQTFDLDYSRWGRTSGFVVLNLPQGSGGPIPGSG